MNPRKTPALYLGGAAAAMFLLAACNTTPADPGPSPTSAPATASPTTSAPPSSASPSSEPTQTQTQTSPTPQPSETQTSQWQEFSTQGLSFKHPKDWTVVPDDCEHCDPNEDPMDNPFTEWKVKNEKGRTLIEFKANSAEDTDGDMDTYQRTKIEQEALPAKLSKPASLYAEHYVSTESDGDTEEKFLVMLINDEMIAERGQQPALSYFSPKKDLYSVMESTGDLPELLGFDEDHVTVDQARQIVQSPEYQTVRQIMLSLRPA